MNKIFTKAIFAKTILALTLSASCTISSATLFNISEVLNGNDDGFKFSGINSAGTQITRFLSTPVSGTYDDITGALDMVLGLDPDNFNAGGVGVGDAAYVDPGFVTLSGNMFFSPALNSAASLTTIFSDEQIDDLGLLVNTTMSFDAGQVACCSNATQIPNAFDGTTMSLLGASAAGLGFDLRMTLTAVPVPAAVWLFGSGLLGLVAVARRKSVS